MREGSLGGFLEAVVTSPARKARFRLLDTVADADSVFPEMATVRCTDAGNILVCVLSKAAMSPGRKVPPVLAYLAASKSDVLWDDTPTTLTSSQPLESLQNCELVLLVIIEGVDSEYANFTPEDTVSFGEDGEFNHGLGCAERQEMATGTGFSMPSEILSRV